MAPPPGLVPDNWWAQSSCQIGSRLKKAFDYFINCIRYYLQVDSHKPIKMVREMCVFGYLTVKSSNQLDQ